MNRKGFTLIELLIVVVIIGILAAIAIPKFSNTKEKAVISAMKSDLRNYASSQESYYADYTSYGNITANTAYFRGSVGNTITSTAATGTSWEATAANLGTTQVCTMGSNTGATGDGAPACS